MESPRHTCVKLVISEPDNGTEFEPIFVKGTWYPIRFDLSITNGLQAWTCHATEEEVKDRASQWDQPVSEYIDLAEKYLGFEQPGSVYGLSDAGNGFRREEVVWKTQSADRLKLEAEKCLAQSEKLSNEKAEFENKIYGKFVEVLNSKKAKLRQLRDRVSKQATASQLHEEEDDSTDRTESFDEETDEGNGGEEQGKNDTGTSKDVPVTRPRGRKRK